MNSCVLMAEIIKDPELRYTVDNQTPIAEMLVQFPGLRSEDPAETLKVVGWGNLAQQIQEQFHQGDRVVIEGRLNMNTIDRPEGFKEKRAELTATRVHSLEAGNGLQSAAKSASEGTARSTSENVMAKPTSENVMAKQPTPQPARESETNYDDIPF